MCDVCNPASDFVHQRDGGHFYFGETWRDIRNTGDTVLFEHLSSFGIEIFMNSFFMGQKVWERWLHVTLGNVNGKIKKGGFCGNKIAGIGANHIVDINFG